MSMITAAQWVPRGFAAPFPEKYELNESEFERISELAKLHLDDAEEDLKEAQEAEDGDEEAKQNGEDDDEMKDEEGGATLKARYVSMNACRCTAYPC